MAAPLWKRAPCKITELCLDKTLVCGQSFRWQEERKGEWIGVVGKRIWKLKQTDKELLYHVCGRKSNLFAPDYCKTKLPASSDQKQKGKQNLKLSKDLKRNKMTDCDQKLATKEENIQENGIFDQCENMLADDDAVLKDYFQLDVNLRDLYNRWSKVDANFEKISKQFEGIRILRQDPVECLFAFICSSNNNITRITSMVEKLALHYGEKIAEVDGKPYYAFPEVSAMAATGVEEKLRSLGFGYRARYIQLSARYIEEKGGEEWLYSLRDKKYKEAKVELMKLCGVGAKVADCVGLFCLDKTGSIPVDTHVWQIAARDYMPKLKQAKPLTDKLYEEIGDHFRNLWGPYAGWAHSVLFTADLRKFKEDTEKSKLPKKKRRSSSTERHDKVKIKKR